MKLLKEKTLLSVEKKLAIKTGCTIQHTGWSCNSCFHNMEIDLKEDIHEYWLAVLSFRGDYPELPPREDLIKELYNKL